VVAFAAGSFKLTAFKYTGWFLAPLLVVASASAAPKDSEANSIAKEAMEKDYLGTDFKAAEKKLHKAVKLCGKDHCSASVRAQLHLDLGVLYISGLKKKGMGKHELEVAVATDPDVKLSSDYKTPAVEKAFVAAGGKLEEPEPKPAAPDEPLEETPPAEETKPVEKPSDGVARNWFTLSFQQDFLTYGATSDVCTGAAGYQCFLQGNSFTGPAFSGSGNQVKGGIGVATRRVLLGYERVFGDNLTLGARLGFAFSGSPKPTTGGGSGLMPFHAEARASYWFGEHPFAAEGLRPYVGLAAGLGEVDGHVTVEYYADQAGYLAGAKGKLDAWRKPGSLFVGAHLGLAYAFSRTQQLGVGLRLLELLGPSATGGAIDVSYGFGL
jgi:hypothetical protein